MGLLEKHMGSIVKPITVDIKIDQSEWSQVQSQSMQGLQNTYSILLNSVGPLLGNAVYSSTSDLSQAQKRLDPRIEKLARVIEGASDTALDGILETAEVITTLHPRTKKGPGATP